jgi:diguanylate cyclase (GGDEF)-like protein
MTLINLDTQSIIGVLVWGNIATGVIALLYDKLSDKNASYKFIIHRLEIIRFVGALGYICLFYRSEINDLISINLGNSLLYFCYFMEACLLFKLMNVSSKKLYLAETAIFVHSVFIFNVGEYISHRPNMRILCASFFVFLLHIIPTLLLLLSKNSNKFKKGISIFYILLMFALIPRMFEAYFNTSLNLLTPTYYQTLLFISLTLMLISNTFVYLLFVKQQNDSQIVQMATYDYLTNVMNRYSFFTEGKLIFESHKCPPRELSFLFFDIDYFKEVNDTYGHAFGDEVLKKIADIIKKNIGPSDLCCRYGGEEFLVLLNDKSQGADYKIAQQILQKVETQTFPSHPDFHMTISAGSTRGIPGQEDTIEDFIKNADAALYHAKRTGRNKLVEYSIDL